MPTIALIDHKNPAADLTADELDQMVRQQRQVVLADFWAPW